MEELKMKEGETYHVKILEISDGNKDVGSKHKYFITGQDKTGKQFKAEYLCPNAGFFDAEERNKAVAAEFPIGIMRYIKCWQLSPKIGTPTIEPADEPGTIRNAWKEHAPNAGGSTSQPGTTPLRYNPSCPVVNLQGSSIAFATAYAKDLLCSEIAANGKHQEVTEITDHDLKRMLGWADTINQHFCDKIQAASAGSPV